MARTPACSSVLLVAASFVYAVVPSMNHFVQGWRHPLLLTALMRLGFLSGTLLLLFLLHRPLFTRRGLAVTAGALRSEWKLFALAMLTTGDVALFSLSYLFVDISVSTAMTAMTPAANVVLLALLNRNWLNGRQALGLSASVLGMLSIMWAGGGTALVVSGEYWRIGVGLGLGLGMVVCCGLTVSALRLGEVLAVDWYWEGLGRGAGLVWCGSMLILGLAQGVTAPLFLYFSPPGDMPSRGVLALMVLMGLMVLLGTSLWAVANGSGLRPIVNCLGNLQPGWAVLILSAAGIAGEVAWPALIAGLALVVGANAAVELWGGPDW